MLMNVMKAEFHSGKQDDELEAWGNIKAGELEVAKYIARPIISAR
jgi:hypothetical protein